MLTQLGKHLLIFAGANGGGGQSGGGGGGGAGLSFFVPMVLIVIVFFWLTHRSDKKQKQERQEMLDSLGENERVVSIGGIHGEIVKVKEDSFILLIDKDNNVRMEVSKGGISRREGEEEEE
ncbi:MAG: preprotein translocase subunit YajC [Planctomycetes bacterium]|nr:preprotein translocase subunit YajC [Planctomycetota bacterium]